MQPVNLKDELVRRAIWEVYSYKNFYNNEPLQYSEMELDHIIPIKLRSDPEELQKVLFECGLEPDFELHSLFNIVPTNRLYNRQKSGMSFESNNIRFYLEQVRKKIPNIEEKIIQLKLNRDIEKHMAMIKSHVDEETESKENLLTMLFSFFSNEEDEFIEQEHSYTKQNRLIFNKQKKRIALNAIMPSYNNLETKCTFSFRTLRARHCTINLNNKVILSELFTGLNDDPKFGTRSFIYCEGKGNHNVNVLDLENAYIHIGDVTLKLAEEDIYVFCEIIDAYASSYVQLVKDIEETLKTHEYQPSRRGNNYKLLSISYECWRTLVNFANRHDVAKGKSEWHIFYRANNFIRVYTDNGHPRYDAGYHAYFYCEFSEDIVYYPGLSSTDVCVTWQFTEDLDKRGKGFINERENWDAAVAYDWFVNEFMLKALGKKGRDKALDKGERFVMINEIFKKVDYLKQKEVINTVDLNALVSILQIHYNYRPHSKYRIRKQEFEGIYDSMLRCLINSKRTDLFYICSKLHLEKCETTQELIEMIGQLKERINDETISGFGLDFLFRALCATLESNSIKLGLEDVKFIRRKLDIFIEMHDREVLLSKYAVEFI